ncbi:MAG: HAD family hydrolase [bacterium]
MNKKIKIVITDFDGTLANDESQVHEEDFRALEELGKHGIVRVIATGRNLYSVKKGLGENFPVDYVILSCGAAIVNWKTKEVIFKRDLNSEQIIRIKDIFDSDRVNYTIQKPAPDNHHFYYKVFAEGNPDFMRRLNVYKDFIQPITADLVVEEATEFLTVLNFDELEIFEMLKSKLDFVNVIRTTSPTDHQSIWMEVFAAGVSKGSAAEWLCNHLGIPQEQSMSIGNDYNDIELLEWTRHSYVVGNAHGNLTERFNTTTSNNENGFSTAVNNHFNLGNG